MACMECKGRAWDDCNTCAAGGYFPRKEEKLHTLREKYDTWKYRIDEVNAGNAVLSVRKWSKKPFCSKQVELFLFDKDSGIDVQKALFVDSLSMVAIGNIEKNKVMSIEYKTISNNDGLSEQDFWDWFKGYDLSKPKAIIHFTQKFRY